MPVPLALAALSLAPGVIQGVSGGVQMAQGKKAEREGERQVQEALNRMERTDIADFNRPAMNQMLMRSRQGMPEASMTYAERGAERAAGAALGAMEDRRAGLTGIGQAQQSLSDTYSQLASMDAQQRLASEQAYIDAQQQQAAMQYEKELGMADINLAMGRTERLEGMRQRQAGQESLIGGIASTLGASSSLLGLMRQETPMDNMEMKDMTDASVFQGQGLATSSYQQQLKNLGL